MPDPDRPAGGDHRRYLATTSELSRVRYEVGAWMQAEGADPLALERGMLVVSELASNAIQANGATEFHVDMQRTGNSSMTLTVTNGVAGPVQLPGPPWAPPGPLVPSGRGLAIVAAVSEQLDLTADHGSQVTVTARLGLGPT